MPGYVAILRGINVGGHHKVRMADLRAEFEAHGLSAVSTYIQSGNVLFASDASEAELAPALAERLEAHFGFPIVVVLRELHELIAAAEAHPLVETLADERLLQVVFLEETPEAEAVRAFEAESFAPDELVVAGRDVYVAYPQGSARSKLTVDVIGRALGSTATGRNWRTVQKLKELALERLASD